MRGRAGFVFALVAALGLGAPATSSGQAAGPVVVLKAGRLADALRELSIRSRVDLLFSPDLVGDRRSPRVVGAMNLETILGQLLDGSGLAYRRTATGAVVIYLAPALPAPPPDPPAVPEILVIGEKTQNTDIRRTQNDIQPYQVMTLADIQSAHADDLDDFLRTRLASDAEPQAPSSDPNGQAASNRSEVNLHGLGATQTLVLIDGGRMPGIPADYNTLSMLQPDLNGVPLIAVNRIETLTGTAGGIYGPGATGGVVNVVLKRDYHGAAAGVTYGVTDRGDAQRWRFDGQLGFTPDGGATDVMITLSQSRSEPLRSGDRPYAEKARALEAAENPSAYLATYPTVNGVLFQSLSGGPLALKSGASLGSSYTYLPTGYSGDPASLASILTANAGRLPSLVSPDGNGAERSLTMDSTVTSLLFNVRHRFSDRIEAFVDLIAYENDGRAVDGILTSLQVVEPSAANPFSQAVIATFPTPGFDFHYTNRIGTARLSTGLIAHLPASWTGEASYSFGGSRDDIKSIGSQLNYDLPIAIAFDRPGAQGEPAPNVFGSASSFAAALQGYKSIEDFRSVTINHFQDGVLRLAGPLFTWKPGTVSLSLVAERREEDVLSAPYTTTVATGSGVTHFPPYSLTVSSLYGELRAPLTPRNGGPFLLHGLEVQLAVRYDDDTSALPSNSLTTYTADAYTLHQGATTYTAGLRVFPVDHLMLRASVATGVLPPTPAQILPLSLTLNIPFIYGDPERGGRTIGSEGAFTLLYGGNTHLQPEQARTLSGGLVINPEAKALPRLSIDFTHIEKTREISDAYDDNIAYFLANESLYPGRVQRAPLTVTDQALGFTGGVITSIDTSRLNIGRTTSDAVDVQFDWRIRLSGADKLRFYGLVTWQPRLSRRTAPANPAIDYVGFEDGPLRWRGNAGVEWSRGPLALGANGQFYAGYYDVDAEDITAGTGQYDLPGVHIPAQFYIDAYLSYRLHLPDRGFPARDIDLRLGIQNLLDHAPPIAINNEAGYSYYGDPRGRRFELSATGRF